MIPFCLHQIIFVLYQTFPFFFIPSDFLPMFLTVVSYDKRFICRHSLRLNLFPFVFCSLWILYRSTVLFCVLFSCYIVGWFLLTCVFSISCEFDLLWVSWMVFDCKGFCDHMKLGNIALFSSFYIYCREKWILFCRLVCLLDEISTLCFGSFRCLCLMLCAISFFMTVGFWYSWIWS